MTGPDAGPALARWDPALYAANTAHHRLFDDAILAGVDLRTDDTVIDIGCGVGDFTSRLAEKVPAGSVHGIDADERLIARASRHHTAPNLRWSVLPAQRLTEAAATGSADAVISVATLHWIGESDHPKLLADIASVLRPGGLFRAEFGGHGQIAAARAILDAESVRAGGSEGPWYFPSAQEYRALVTQAGFDTTRGWVRTLTQRRRIPDADAVIGWLRSQVLIAYQGSVPAANWDRFAAVAADRVVSELRRADSSYDQDYVRTDVLGYRR